MFKNLTLFRVLKHGAVFGLPDLIAALAVTPWQPCAPTQPLSLGWTSPRGFEHGALVEACEDNWLMRLKVEQRVLPAQVVARCVKKLADDLEATTGRKPGKKAMRDLKEQAIHGLLPTAFTRQSHVDVWWARDLGLLLIDTTNATRLDEIITLLIAAVPDLTVTRVQSATAPTACMTAWLLDGVPPEHFSIGRACELKGNDQLKPTVRYANHALGTDEVRAHLISGKRPTRLDLDWSERVSFTLTEGLAIKGIQFLALAFEGREAASGDAAFDADLALATGELGRLVPALVQALGGEMEVEA